jgi:hypothetical protein
MNGTPTVSDDMAMYNFLDSLFVLAKSINLDQKLNVFTLIQTEIVKLLFKYTPDGICKDPFLIAIADKVLLFRSAAYSVLNELYALANDTTSFKLLSKLQ